MAVGKSGRGASFEGPLLRSGQLGEKQGCASSDLDKIGLARAGGRKIAIFAAKLLVTATCFWYVARRIEFGQVFPVLDFRWLSQSVRCQGR
jgi:hypothetical protein